MYFEDVEIGKVYKAEGTKTVTGTEIDIIAQMSGMNVPGFLSADYAKSKGFKDRVTPGVYVIASMIGLMTKQGFLEDVVAMVGMRDITFTAPVYPGDRLTAEVEALSIKESRRGGIVTYKWRVNNQEGVLIAEGVNT
jgi:acyl dehydratase